MRQTPLANLLRYTLLSAGVATPFLLSLHAHTQTTRPATSRDFPTSPSPRTAKTAQPQPADAATIISLPDIGDFTSYTDDTSATFTGTGFVGMYSTAWAHLLGLEGSDGSRTIMQADVSALTGRAISGAVLSFDLLDGDCGIAHTIRATVFKNNSGELDYSFNPPAANYGSVDFTVYGCANNSVDLGSLVMQALADGTQWLGIHLEGVDKNASPWTYTYSGYGYDADRANVRLTITPASCVAPPGGMVSWWPGQNDANDIQDGNDGTFNGTAAYGIGEVGRAFSFNGDAANYVSVAPNINLDLPHFTVDAWIYPRTEGDAAYFVDKSGGNGTNYYLALTADGRAEFGFYDTAYRTIDSTDVVPVNRWTHVTGTYDGATLKLYINGVQITTLDYAGTPPVGQTINIGRRNDGNYPFNGLVDEVEVFNRALGADEVAALYNAGSAGKCRSCVSAPDGMISWWRGDGNTDDIISAHNGTNNGATFTPGEVNDAFTFAGVSQNVAIPDSSDWNFGSGDFTFDFWEKSSSSDREHALSFEPEANTRNLDFDFNDTVGLWVYWNGGGNNAIQVGSLGQYTDAQWHHIALTKEGSTITLYIDGAVAGSTSYDSSFDLSGAANNFIGSSNGQHFWNGQIDEVEIFGRALTQREIQSIYDAQGAGKCQPTSGHEVDGSGAINSGGRRAEFNLHVTTQNAKAKGFVQYHDSTEFHFSTTTITSLVVNGNHARITGLIQRRHHKQRRFTINVTDNGVPGTLDTFSIRVSNGYSASGNLTSGNLTVH